MEKINELEMSHTKPCGCREYEIHKSQVIIVVSFGN